MAVVGTLAVNLIAKTQAFEREMKRSRKQIGYFHRDVKTAQGRMLRFGRGLLAAAGIGGGFYMLTRTLQASIREFAAFEKQLATVSTMLDKHTEHLLPKYTEQLRRMSREFGEGTATLSKGLYDILSASVEPGKALDVLAVSAKAAKAGITDTGTAADVVTTILNSYRLEAERAGDVSDKLFAIVKRGKTTFAELAPNIGKVTSLAATSGLSFDNLGASIATMTRAGVQTEIAITSLRAILLSFLKPQADSIEMARKYGVELNSTTLRTIGLTGVIEKLRKATAEELAIIVPTSRAISGFAAAIQNAEGMTADYELMLNAAGKTETAYHKITGTTSHQLDQLSQEWAELKRTMGEVSASPIISVLKDITSAVKAMREQVDNTKQAWRGLFIRMGIMKPVQRITFTGERKGAGGGPTATRAPSPEILAPPGGAGLPAGIGTDGVTETPPGMPRMQMYQRYLEQLQRDMDNWSEYMKDQWAGLAMDAEGSMGNMFGNMIMDGKNWRDHMAGFFNDIARAASQMAGQAVARQLFGSILGGIAGGAAGGGQAAYAKQPYPVHHGGGIVGEGFARRSISAAAFLGAPRLHNGLRSDEVPAILQKGEQVIPKNEVGGGGPVNLNFYSHDPDGAYRLFYNNRKVIANMMTQARNENHTYGREQR